MDLNSSVEIDLNSSVEINANSSVEVDALSFNEYLKSLSTVGKSTQ